MTLINLYLSSIWKFVPAATNEYVPGRAGGAAMAVPLLALRVELTASLAPTGAEVSEDLSLLGNPLAERLFDADNGGDPTDFSGEVEAGPVGVKLAMLPQRLGLSCAGWLWQNAKAQKNTD